MRSAPLRIGNSSGFYGDRASAMADLAAAGGVDVLTGDYLAEVTMLILGKARAKDSSRGYAATFLQHLDAALEDLVANGIRLVVNAGGLNPGGLAAATRELVAGRGYELRVSHLEGDDVAGRLDAFQQAGHSLRHLTSGEPLSSWAYQPLTANAYLGGFGIARALEQGADIVITGRVADASLVVGPAAWWWGWSPHDYDALAGAIAAGHVIECGPHATGGNFSGFRSIADLVQPGFPIAEIAADGSCVITKDPGTGGAVTEDTVTAQLLYEIGAPAYLNPDVTTHLDTAVLTDLGDDRVQIRDVRGSAPPATTKVAITAVGGWANSVILTLTGNDLDAKAELVERSVHRYTGSVDGIDAVAIDRIGQAQQDPDTQNAGTELLRIAVQGTKEAAGRAFSSRMVELALSSYPGLYAPGSRLTTDLAASLFTPAGMRVTDVRSSLLTSPRRIVGRTTMPEWLAASRARIADLRRIARESRGDLERAVARDLAAAVARRRLIVAVALVLLALVAALTLVLRRSITRPLAEVSGSARALSSGDLSADVNYIGRDEIGDVAEAFRDLHVTSERMAGEIRAMNAAITEDRLEHRADVAALEGTWSQLLGGMNETMAAFAELQGRRREAELEFERVFTMSVDLLCISGFDGYLKRVNPAWMRTFGYTEQELLSRPFLELVHPDDRAHTEEVVGVLAEGRDLVEFENRNICRDGSARWLQWTARAALEQGLTYSVGRDVTDRKRREAEEAALRRVATLVARAVAPAEVFDAVAREVGLQCDADIARLERFERDGTVTVVAAWSRSGGDRPAVGVRFARTGTSVAALVATRGRPVRVDSFQGASGPVARENRALGIRSSVGCPIVVGGRTWGVIAVSMTREARFPPNTESGIADFTELVAMAILNAESQHQLTASRARLLTEADAARRRIVRDLHDGAQQRLVHTSITLGLAQHELEQGNGAAQALIAEALEHAQRANEQLRELAHGILPADLTRGGLRGGIDAVVERLHLAVKVDLPTERFPAEIEANAYFIVAEALTNIVKHAHAESAVVSGLIDEGMLKVEVRDDGIGGADPSGRGLVGINDRVTALGGQFSVESPAGGGTVLSVTLPIPPSPLDREAAGA